MNFTMYRPYSSTMGATLSLLISDVGGSAMEKNLKRLLGVVLGKVIPIIIIGNLDYFGCEKTDRFVAQGIAVFIFIFAFEYINFTSPSWGYVGGLIAAFGCYPLFTYPTCEGYVQDNGQATFIGNYEELCEVTTGILLQMFVDNVFERFSARDFAIQHLTDVKTRTTGCLRLFFGLQTEGLDLRDKKSSALASLNKAKGLISEVDPMKLVAPGSATPFRLDLYKEALGLLTSVLGDLNMIIVAIHEPKDNQDETNAGSEETMNTILKQLTSWKTPQGGNKVSLQDDAIDMIESVCNILVATLDHREETQIADEGIAKILERFESEKLARSIFGRTELYAECAKWAYQGEKMSQEEKSDEGAEGAEPAMATQHAPTKSSVKDLFKVRISVIVVSLDNIVKTMGRLAQICVRSNIH